MQWTPAPFAGQWGITTSFFQAASQESKQKNIKSNVPLRAQEMAQSVADGHQHECPVLNGWKLFGDT